MQTTEGQPLMSLSDRCYMHRDDVHKVQDTEGGAGIASVESQQCVKALLDLGLACTETGRGAAQDRPTVEKCIYVCNDVADALRQVSFALLL